MAVDQESFNKQLYDLLKLRGYKPVPKNARNQDVEATQLADVIEFQFIKDGEDYGKAWASIDNASNVVVYYSDEQADSPEGRTPGVEYDDSWSGFLQHLKKWAQRKQLSFELSNKDRLSDDMRQREYVKMKEKINEGYYPMGKQASYNDAVPTVKIILQHTRQIQEGEQRFRNIAKIFLENQLGERILAPTVRPGIAQVYARHLAEGGVPNDERWNHIKGLCEEYNKMAGFVRATKNGQFNESAQQLINEGISHYQSLRETLGKMRGHRGYNAYFESYTPTLMETEGDESLNELFVQETLDPRIESVMPILSRLRKNVKEMAEVSVLENWADSVINEKMDSTTATMAVPADKMLDEGEDRPYVCVHAKKGKHECKASSSYEAAKKAAQHWGLKSTAGIDAYLADVKHSPASIGEAEGAETLAHNQSTEKSNLKAFGLAEDQDSVDAVAGSITRRIMSQHTDLLRKYGPVAVMAAIDDIANSAGSGGLDEIGSSDVSIWTKQVIQDLESGMYSHIKEDAGQEIKNALEFLQKKLATTTDPKEKEQLQKYIKYVKDKQQGAATKTGTDDPLSKTQAEVDKILNKKSQGGNFNQKFDAGIGGLLAAGGLGLIEDEDLDEGMMKHKMHADAEKMSLEAFLEKYAHHEDDKVWLKDFWRDSNGVEEGVVDTLKKVGKKVVDYMAPSDEQSLKDLQKRMGIPQHAQHGKPSMAKPNENVEEDLDANQKRAGQLGPTEKVKNNNIGKLVGANESVEHDPLDDIKRLLGK